MISYDDRVMSYDVTRHRATSRNIVRYLCNGRATTSYDFIYDRMTSYDFIYDRTTVIRSSYDIVEVARPSRDFNLFYKTILASHHAIIVKSYVSVRLSYDHRSTGVRCRTIYLSFSFSPGSNYRQ